MNTAPTPTACTAAAVFKPNLLHHAYPVRVMTGGNLAFAFTPSQVNAHQAYRFVLYRVMHGAPMQSLSRFGSIEIGGGTVH